MSERDYQAWINEMQEVCEDFADDDEDLRELLLDNVDWDACFDDGLTPQEALASLDVVATLAKFKASKQGHADDSWWPHKMRGLLVDLAQSSPPSLAIRADIDALIDQIVARYRSRR